VPVTSFGALVAVALVGGGVVLALLALAAAPLGLGAPGFGYRKLLLLLGGLECCGCGLLLWRRLRHTR
jgi:hypothetical protein